MARLGISIYPEHSEKEKDIEYIRLAGKYGFSRIFTCLLSVEGKGREEVTREFRELIDVAHGEGMEVILDVSPLVFERFGIEWNDLSLFGDMHADGIRLDEGFTAEKSCRMTYNDLGLKVEVNASTKIGFIREILENHPCPGKLITCHNFYPQRYTGLGMDHFNRCNEAIRKLGLPIAAFVSSNNKDTFGPWPVYEGLPTLEEHRELPIDVQVRHLYAMGTVDDIIIGNAYASEEELKACAEAKPGLLTFGIELETELTETDRKILYFDRQHEVRGDMNDYVVRSTYTRVYYADCPVPPANTRDMKRGDVVIINEGYKKYKGELQIVLKDMPNDGRKNVIGHLPEHELRLLDYVEPWRMFAFK